MRVRKVGRDRQIRKGWEIRGSEGKRGKGK